MSFRSKPAAQVVNDIDTLFKKHGVHRVEAVDNILDMKYFKDLVPALAEKTQKYNIFYETKANLNRQQIKLLADAGIRWIQPGIESLDSRVLELIGKGSKAWQNISLLKWARQFGVRVAWNTIFSFPNEKDDWYAETAKLFPLLTHLEPGAIIELRYDRFSPYHRNQEKYNLKLVPNRMMSFIFPFPARELENLV